MGLNPPLSASASKPIRLGVATAQQLMVTILDSSTVSKGIFVTNSFDLDAEPHVVKDDASAQRLI